MSLISNLRNAPAGTLHFSDQEKNLAVKTEGSYGIRWIKSVVSTALGDKHNEIRNQFKQQFEQEYKGLLKHTDLESLSNRIDTESRRPLHMNEIRHILRAAEGLAKDTIQNIANNGIGEYRERPAFSAKQCVSIWNYIDKFNISKDELEKIIKPQTMDVFKEAVKSEFRSEPTLRINNQGQRVDNPKWKEESVDFKPIVEKLYDYLTAK